MSNKNDEKINSTRKMFERRVVFNPDETNLSCVNDITKDIDCLKISILNKASRVSGEFDKVTLGPGSNQENSNGTNAINEDVSKINKPTSNGTMSSKTNLTFSITKIRLENEKQRRDIVKRIVDRKKQEMEKSQKQIQDELSEKLSKMAIQREKEAAERIARLEAEEEQLAQQQEMDRKNKDHQRRLKESEEIFKKIVPFRESFHAKWRDIANVSKACHDKNSASRLITQYASKLKDLSAQMESINEKAETGDLTHADIKMAEILAQCNAEVFLSFQADIDKIDKEYELEINRREQEVKKAELAAQEEAIRMKQIEDAKVAAKIAAEAVKQDLRPEQQKPQHQQLPLPPSYPTQTEVDSASSIQPSQNIPESFPQVSSNEVPLESKAEESSEYPDSESFQIYLESHQFLQAYTTSYQEFLKSDAMKKIKFECQKTLNIAVNAISSASREQLVDKYEKLKSFLSGKGNPNILQNPQAEAFSKSLLAQKFVDQGDTSISSKPELAFPFAAIAVALWNDWPDLGTLLLVHFRTKSPFFVPVFLMPRPDQTAEDYVRSLGWKNSDDGQLEKPEQFFKRIGGMMYLYASILVTKQRKGVNKPHPHGLGNAWRWLAATLNIEPRCDTAEICAILIHNMLEITGNDLWKTYPNQFPKMLQVLNNVYYEKLKSFDTAVKAPVERLGLFLSDALKNNTIPPPKGQLPPNFW